MTEIKKITFTIPDLLIIEKAKKHLNLKNDLKLMGDDKNEKHKNK